MMSTFALGPLPVRRSGYGAMQLAGSFAYGTPPDRASAIGVLEAAVAAGVDHIDTAQYYGPGTVNELIREALYPYPSGLAIVSKVAVRPDGPDQLRQGIEDNLRTLRDVIPGNADSVIAPRCPSTRTIYRAGAQSMTSWSRAGR
jgi:pyridoxine 4-dehydrogenase